MCSRLAGCGLDFLNASRGVACTQTSVPFRNAIKKILFTKICVHLHKFIVPSAVAVLAVSLLRRDEGKKTVMKARKG